jgi:hypothetical protein
MAGELLIQVIDIARFRAIRPALDELDAGRALGPESRAVLNEAAISPFARSERRPGFATLLDRILRHPELELRVFLAPRELDEVIEGVVHVLCFENGAESSLVTPIGPSWVVLDSALAVFIDLDWYRAIFLDADPEDRRLLAYPRAGFEECYRVLDREEVARVTAELQPLLGDPIPAEVSTLLATRAEQRYALHAQGVEQLQTLASQIPEARAEVRSVIEMLYAGSSLENLALALSQEVRAAAEGLSRLAAKALSREELTLAHTSLL